MEELLKIKEKYNVSDKDLYILSKLESDKKSASIFEKEKINSKQRSILSAYKINFQDKIKVLKKLKESNYHLDSSIIEKYSNSEHSEELNEIGQKGKKKAIAIFAIIFLIVIGVSMKNNNNTTDNNSNENNNTTVSDCNVSNHEQFVRKHFEDTGNDVYGISVAGETQNCGYVFMVNGYNKSKGLQYTCTVKTSGSSGIKIIDAACDFN